MSLEKNSAKTTATSQVPSDRVPSDYAVSADGVASALLGRAVSAGDALYGAALSGLTAAYRRYVLERGREPVENENTTSALRKVARWLSSDGCERRPWLTLAGNVGVGKTAMLNAMLHMLSPRYPRTTLGTGYSIPGVLLSSALRIARYGEDEVRQAVSATVLLMDDFGAEPVTVKLYGSDAENVTDVLYERYDRRRTTVISTNLMPDDIAARYGERIADRFAELTDRVVFDFKSFRRL